MTITMIPTTRSTMMMRNTKDHCAMRRSSSTALIMAIVIVAVLSSSCCRALVTNGRLGGKDQRRCHSLSPQALISSQTKANTHYRHYMVHNTKDADLMEVMMGGQRFEMVPLPDSMLDTTIFVGNLCEFAKDEDLSNVFQSVSRLQSVPACVVRKANMASLKYAFVSFPTVEEKEVRFQDRQEPSGVLVLW
jgi:hypothetical protein